MSNLAQERRQRLIGIALMCGAVACFSCLDTTAKFLNQHMGTMQVVWARYVSAFLIALIFLNPWNRPGLMSTGRPVLQVTRSALLLTSTICNFGAIHFLRLDQALAIAFSGPLFVALLSGPLLGEWVGWRRWIAIGVGFIGVLVVIRPGLGGMHPAMLLSVGTAVSYGLYAISTRALVRTDSSETTLFYSNLVGAVAMTPLMPFVWTAPGDALLVVLMVAFGAFGSFGHYLLIIGHRMAPPAVLAPFMYTQLIWSTSLGFLVFADVPDRWAIAGASIVVGSGLYMLYRERRSRGEA